MSTRNMNSTTHNYDCTHPASDLIEAVAFGLATREEIRTVQQHVETCEACAQALRDARMAAEALPLSLDEMDVPDSVWAGIEQRIGVETDSVETVIASPVSTTQNPAQRLTWTIAAVLAVFALVMGILLGRTFFEPETEAPVVPEVAISITDPEIDASGTVQYLQNDGVILLTMENFPDAPEGFVYQVWMIEGDAPISMGVMEQDATRFAVAGDPAQFDLLAITLEEGPRGSDQPTSDPIVVAELAPLTTG